MIANCTKEYRKSGVAFERYTSDTEAIRNRAKEMNKMGLRFSRIKRYEHAWLMDDYKGLVEDRKA